MSGAIGRFRIGVSGIGTGGSGGSPISVDFTCSIDRCSSVAEAVTVAVAVSGSSRGDCAIAPDRIASVAWSREMPAEPRTSMAGMGFASVESLLSTQASQIEIFEYGRARVRDVVFQPAALALRATDWDMPIERSGSATTQADVSAAAEWGTSTRADMPGAVEIKRTWALAGPVPLESLGYVVFGVSSGATLEWRGVAVVDLSSPSEWSLSAAGMAGVPIEISRSHSAAMIAPSEHGGPAGATLDSPAGVEWRMAYAADQPTDVHWTTPAQAATASNIDTSLVVMASQSIGPDWLRSAAASVVVPAEALRGVLVAAASPTDRQARQLTDTNQAPSWSLSMMAAQEMPAGHVMSVRGVGISALEFGGRAATFADAAVGIEWSVSTLSEAGFQPESLKSRRIEHAAPIDFTHVMAYASSALSADWTSFAAVSAEAAEEFVSTLRSDAAFTISPILAVCSDHRLHPARLVEREGIAGMAGSTSSVQITDATFDVAPVLAIAAVYEMQPETLRQHLQGGSLFLEFSHDLLSIDAPWTMPVEIGLSVSADVIALSDSGRGGGFVPPRGPSKGGSTPPGQHPHAPRPGEDHPPRDKGASAAPQGGKGR